MSVVAEVRGLHRRFDKVHAVKGVSFACEAGKITGFIGPNGAGKTTTMRIMATLDQPTEGDCFVNGHSVVDHPEKAKRFLGYMPEMYGVYDNLDVAEYVDFYARAGGLRGTARRRAAEQVMAFTELTHVRDRLANTLSKGMKQRLALARALITDPALLVLDEPAAGLDPRARIEFRELCKQLAAAGKSLLISSHILTELTEICESVVIIEQGAIVASGSVRDIYSRLQSHADIHLRPLDRHGQLERFLLEQPLVDMVSPEGPSFVVRFQGDEEAQADLLARAVAAGFRLVEFRARPADLESLFMKLTRGDLA